MNRMSLSSLYRRLTPGTDAVALDAGDLAAAADGTLAADRREHVAQVLASSSAQANVVRMLRDLKSESETLAADVARTARETTHRRHQRGDRRIAASRRVAAFSAGSRLRHVWSPWSAPGLCTSRNRGPTQWPQVPPPRRAAM